jgi:hypothetical protein
MNKSVNHLLSACVALQLGASGCTKAGETTGNTTPSTESTSEGASMLPADNRQWIGGGPASTGPSQDQVGPTSSGTWNAERPMNAPSSGSSSTHGRVGQGTGAGGSSGLGGSTGMGGSTGTGGFSGTGGSSGLGGSTGMGGFTGTGGFNGTGGSATP